MEAAVIEQQVAAADEVPLRGLLDDSDEESVPDKDVADSETLDDFRRRWHEELCEKEKSTSRDCVETPKESAISTPTFERARERFLEGVACERRGDMFEAVRHYHWAVRLVPDIEQRLYAQPTLPHVNSERALRALTADDDIESQVLEESGRHRTVLESIDLRQVVVLYGNGPYCHAVTNLTHGQRHLSQLNLDTWLVIIRWLVGEQSADIRQLDVLSRCCRGLYALCRLPIVWRTVCMQLYRDEALALYNCSLTDGEWRQAALMRPHAWSDGVYIGKCTYIRHGEASYQDQFYKPWHLVVYYRYLRLLADGRCLLVTTTGVPQDTVASLRNVRGSAVKQSLNNDANTILNGTYDYVGAEGQIKCKLRRVEPCEKAGERQRLFNARRNARRTGRRVPADVEICPEYFYEMELRCVTPKRCVGGTSRQYGALQWLSYKSTTFYVDSGRSVECNFDVQDQSAFPTLFFSRVRSYTAQCDDSRA